MFLFSAPPHSSFALLLFCSFLNQQFCHSKYTPDVQHWFRNRQFWQLLCNFLWKRGKKGIAHALCRCRTFCFCFILLLNATPMSSLEPSKSLLHLALDLMTSINSIPSKGTENVFQDLIICSFCLHHDSFQFCWGMSLLFLAKSLFSSLFFFFLLFFLLFFHLGSQFFFFIFYRFVPLLCGPLCQDQISFVFASFIFTF